MARSIGEYEWELIFVLPNLILKEPFETDYMAIIPYNDKRLKFIRSNNPAAKKLLTNFKTIMGKRVKPPALIWRKDAPITIQHNEAVVAFRNSLALSCLLYCCSVSVNANNILGPKFSDYFDFYPVTIGKEGSFHITSPALVAYGPSLNKFYGSIYPHLLYHEFLSAEIDKFMAEKLIKKWNERFVSPAKDTWDTRLLFRSLEMAYQAMVTPFRNNSTVYDYGTNLSLWVSALEILVHEKPEDRVGWRQVTELLSKYRWGPKELRGKWYTIHKDKKQKKTIKGNLVRKLYMELYDSRNAFLHGNQIKSNHLFPFHNKQRPLLAMLAPSIYWTALSVFLPSNDYNDKSVEAMGKAYAESIINSAYEIALISSIGLGREDIYQRKS